MNIIWFIGLLLYLFKYSHQMTMGEVTAKTIYKWTSEGPIMIREVNEEGKFILLENISFGSDKMIFGSGLLSVAGPNDLVFMEEGSWGVGLEATTSLVNDKNEEKATLVKKTVYS